MSEDRLLSISSSPSQIAPDEVSQHSFGVVRKGFDPEEVRSYLDAVAAAMRSIIDREHVLQNELADARHRAANPVLDESTLTQALGQEMAKVLHSAHEAAAEIVARAEEEADRLLTASHDSLAEQQAALEQRQAALDERQASLDSLVAERLAEAEAAIALEKGALEEELANRRAAVSAELEALSAEAQEAAAGRLSAADDQAVRLVERTKEECRAMVEEAQRARVQVLTDLAHRRKTVSGQIERLRAGRDRLAQTIGDVQTSVNVIVGELAEAENNARSAAEAAAREASQQIDLADPEALAAEFLPVSEGSVASGAGDGAAQPADESPESEDAGDAAAAGTPLVESVDALFAKIRATAPEEPGSAKDTGGEAPEAEHPATEAAPRSGSRSRRKGAKGAGVPAAEATPDPPADKEPADKEPAVTQPADQESVDTQPADTQPDNGGRDVAGSPAVESGGDDKSAGPPEPTDPAILQRDEMLAPVVTGLARRLKRSLQDSQNDLLDTLRGKGAQWSIDLLPTTDEFIDALSTALLPMLTEAAGAGATFAGHPEGKEADPDALLGVARDLAGAVEGPLRRRLAADEGLAGAEIGAITEHVGGAFREWKGDRIDSLAGDHAVVAFSLGTLAVLADGEGTSVTWMPVGLDGQPPCPDCEDNGLTGPQSPGDEFPTGHRHPPAHPGCRCLLVIATP